MSFLPSFLRPASSAPAPQPVPAPVPAPQQAAKQAQQVLPPQQAAKQAQSQPVQPQQQPVQPQPVQPVQPQQGTKQVQPQPVQPQQGTKQVQLQQGTKQARAQAQPQPVPVQQSKTPRSPVGTLVFGNKELFGGDMPHTAEEQVAAVSTLLNSATSFMFDGRFKDPAADAATAAAGLGSPGGTGGQLRLKHMLWQYVYVLWKTNRSPDPAAVQGPASAKLFDRMSMVFGKGEKAQVKASAVRFVETVYAVLGRALPEERAQVNVSAEDLMRFVNAAMDAPGVRMPALTEMQATLREKLRETGPPPQAVQAQARAQGAQARATQAQAGKSQAQARAQAAQARAQAAQAQAQAARAQAQASKKRQAQAQAGRAKKQSQVGIGSPVLPLQLNIRFEGLQPRVQVKGVQQTQKAT
jgi:hypothetical protein